MNSMPWFSTGLAIAIEGCGDNLNVFFRIFGFFRISFLMTFIRLTFGLLELSSSVVPP